MPRHSRHVGQGRKHCPSIWCSLIDLLALKFLGDETVPWHRVLRSTGQIASRGPGTDGASRQRLALEQEGVVVTQGPMDGEGGKVSWAEYGWFPENVEIEEE